MKIYNLKKLSFGNNVSDYPEPGTLVKCRGQLGIYYIYASTFSNKNRRKVFLLGDNGLPYTVVPYSHNSCKEIIPPQGYTKEYGKSLCEIFRAYSHKFTSEGIIFDESI